jgi:hypothetical protein
MRTTRWLKASLIPLVITFAATGTRARPGDLPECPHDWEFSKIKIRVPKVQRPVSLQPLNTDNRLSAPGYKTNVPEFNDCQRLVWGSGTTAKYGALYAVFAWDHMDSVNLIDSALANNKALPIVEVLSLGGRYQPLSIFPGFSCLFVSLDSGKWVGRLVYFGAVEGDCHEPRPVDELDTVPHAKLSITRTTYPTLDWSQYPAVARWDWDVESNTQVIGFKCHKGWCEAGRPGKSPNTGPNLSVALRGVPGLAGSPVLQVKGWYDQQRLSPTAKGWWHPGAGPTSVVGTIIPAPGLALLESTHFNLTWQLVAYVNLSEPSLEYKRRHNMVPKIGDLFHSRLTTISMCAEDWGGPNPLLTGAGCQGVSEAQRKHATCKAEVNAPNVHWWGKTDPADGGPPRYWCVVRREVTEALVPGTARWRWMADDEITWDRCGAGCCSGH